MPYLNWKTRQIQKQLDPQSDARSTLMLTLSSEERAELMPFLEEVYLRGGAELRLDLPDNWIVFWKTRESESRLLLAHPQQNEWVSTVALEAQHGTRALEHLRKLGAGDSFSISEEGAIGYVSNVEVVFSLK